MPRPPTESLTPRESQLMECLWQFGAATAEQIRGQLPGAAHDSSVRTLLRVLEEKGYVGHTLHGKAYVYAPLVPREAAQSQAASTLLQRLFRGSAASLVLRLLEDEEISPAELQSLAAEAAAAARPPAAAEPAAGSASAAKPKSSAKPAGRRQRRNERGS